MRNEPGLWIIYHIVWSLSTVEKSPVIFALLFVSVCVCVSVCACMCVCVVCMCVCVSEIDCCHSPRHNNLFPQLLGTISKVPGDQLALETQWCGCGDNLLKLWEECYKQTGPQEPRRGPQGTLGPLSHKNKPWRSLRNITLMVHPPGCA